MCRSFGYVVFFLGFMLDGKEERKKGRRTKSKFLGFDFLNCEEKSWDSGATFYIRIAKGFHL